MVRNASWKIDAGILEDAVVAADGVVEGKEKEGEEGGVEENRGGQATRLMYRAIHPSADPAHPGPSNHSLCLTPARQCFIFMSNKRGRYMTAPINTPASSWGGRDSRGLEGASEQKSRWEFRMC